MTAYIQLCWFKNPIIFTYPLTKIGLLVKFPYILKYWALLIYFCQNYHMTKKLHIDSESPLTYTLQPQLQLATLFNCYNIMDSFLTWSYYNFLMLPMWEFKIIECQTKTKAFTSSLLWNVDLQLQPFFLGFKRH